MLRRLSLPLVLMVLLTLLPERLQAAADGDSATVRLYRITTYFADKMEFDVYLGDQAVYRAVVGTRREVQVPAGAKVKLVAKKGKAYPLTLSPEAGGIYYIRCAAEVSGSASHPAMTLVDAETGLREYETTETVGPPVIEIVKISPSRLITSTVRTDPRFQVTLAGGVSFRKSTFLYYSHDAYTPHFGPQPSLSAAWYFTESMGVGLLGDFQYLKTKQAAVRIYYCGASFATRRIFEQHPKETLEGGLALGYFHLYERFKDISAIRGNGSIPAMQFFVNYYHQLNSHLYFNAGSNFLLGGLHRFKRTYMNGSSEDFDDGGSGMSTNLARFDLHVGLTFKW